MSPRTATAATLLCIVLGTPLALVLARIAGGWWLTALRALVLIPLVLPPVVGGLALLYTFGRRGLIGHYLEIAGISVAFSTTAVVLAQTFVSLPFLVLGLEGALRSVGERYDAAAACLGARPGVVFTRVTLPHPAGSGDRVDPRLRSFAGRVRRDADLCGQLARSDPDAASGDLPAPGDRPGGSGRTRTRAGVRRGRGDRGGSTDPQLVTVP